MTEKDKLIQDLKRERDLLKKKVEYTKEFIEERCVYDEHLMGYCFDLKSGDVRRLMYKLKKE